MRIFDTPVCILGFIFTALFSSFIFYDRHLVQDLSDTLITAQVKSAFFFHPKTEVNSIHVETNGSNVVLSGMVASEKEAKIATFISKTVPGVLSVNTQQLMIKDMPLHKTI